MTGAMIESVEVNGGRLGFEVAGAGPAVAFVHPGSWARRTWDDGLRSSRADTEWSATTSAATGADGPERTAGARAASDRNGSKNVAAPTLVLPADRDIPHTRRLCRIVAERIPGARLVQIPDTDHVVNMRRPAEFNQVVPESLGEVL